MTPPYFKTAFSARTLIWMLCLYHGIGHSMADDMRGPVMRSLPATHKRAGSMSALIG